MHTIRRARLLSLLALVTLQTVAAAPSARHISKSRFDWAQTKYFYAFGDSYTFVQGTQGLANFSFIGDAFDVGFTPQELLTNEIIPENTSSNGGNWVEYLTGCKGGLPSHCQKQLWDFAFAGADIDKNLLPLHHNFTLDLADEVYQWEMYAKDVVPHPDSQTMVAWWIGINDTGDTLGNTTITNFTAFWKTEMTSYFKSVQSVYDGGLRGTYLFLNVPPGDRAPAHVGGSALLKAHIEKYNSILADYITDFESKNVGVNVLTFDTNGWFNMVLDHPQTYGFKNVTGFCTCTDDTFFWYNTGHPTQRVHRLLAAAIEDMLKGASRLNEVFG